MNVLDRAFVHRSYLPESGGINVQVQLTDVEYIKLLQRTMLRVYFELAVIGLRVKKL